MRARRSARASLAALAGLLLSAASSRPLRAAERPPAFALRCLGVLGGGDESNLSSYLLARPGDASAEVMIDGGSIIPGILRWKVDEHALAPAATWDERMRVILPVLAPLRALLVTHAHLDHVAGFLLGNPQDAELALAGRPPLEVIGLPATIEALRAHVFGTPLWGDFTRVPAPPRSPALRLAALEPGALRAVGPFQVEAIPLVHPVPSAAYLVRSGDAAYLHLGDTGRSTAVWDAARPFLVAGQLRAIAVEVSFPSRKEELAKATGHLTPASLLLELAALTQVSVEKKRPDELARAVAARLGRTRVVAIHIKAPDHDEVVRELAPLVAAGIAITIPEQGKRYLF